MKKKSSRAYLEDTVGYKNIIRILRERRRNERLTQTMISKMTGYSPSNIGKFEKGHINNARLMLYYILILGVDINDLLRGEPKHDDEEIPF